MKIGIYGGCFNPPHKMHEKIAKNLIKEGYVDKVIFVPTGDYYPKKNQQTAEKRLEMLNLICESEKGLETSDYEINNQKYTYQTLKYFQEKYPKDKIYFITGSDNYKELDTWKNYNEILEKYYLIVIQRSKDDLEKINEKYKGQNKNVIFVVFENTEISSTIIRKKISNGAIQEELRKYMNEKIIQYITRNRIYFML